MPLETLDFEEPIAIVLKEIEALRCCRRPTRAIARSSRCAGGSSRCAAELYKSLTPWQRVLVARHPNRPEPRGFHPAAVHRVHRDSRRSPLRRRPRAHDRLCRLQGAAGAARRPRQGRRHQGKDLPQLRLRAARGLPQGDARDAAGGEVQPADHRVRRHAGGVSRASSRRSAASPRRSPSTCAT